MKKGILVLVMIAIAGTAYNQSSRRTTNVNANSSRNTERATVTVSNTNPREVSHSNSRNSTPDYSHSNHSRTQRTRESATSTYSYHRPHEVNTKHTVNYYYRVPAHVNVVWTSEMHRHYVNMYPGQKNWNCHYGQRIYSIPAYKAGFYVGNVGNVYGRISDIFYSRRTDEYFLYVGNNYPYQDFTVVVPGNIARQRSHRPEYYYMNQYINVTGLITSFEGNAEIIVRRNSQIDVY